MRFNSGSNKRGFFVLVTVPMFFSKGMNPITYKYWYHFENELIANKLKTIAAKTIKK